MVKMKLNREKEGENWPNHPHKFDRSPEKDERHRQAVKLAMS